MSGDKSIQYETKTLPSGIVVENITDCFAKKLWLIKGTNVLHNEGGPAYESISGYKVWYNHNKRHRLELNCFPRKKKPCNGGRFSIRKF